MDRADRSLQDPLGPAVAGTWYPATPATLRPLLEQMLSGPPATSTPAPSALIAPHAGYRYSGHVAGDAFRLVRGRAYDRVLLLGPSHYAAFDGACVPRASRYRTPLGEVEIDGEAARSSLTRGAVRQDDEPFRPEHSLEAEIPFLQTCLAPGWRLLPVLLGGNSPATSNARVADALRPLVDGRTLVVVSSDFTHYGHHFRYVPFEDRVPERIRELDMGAIEIIVAGNRRGFLDYADRTGATICGRAAIDTLLALLPATVGGELVSYDTSGRMTGDWTHSVSYAGLSFAETGDASR